MAREGAMDPGARSAEMSRAKAYALPISAIHPADPELFVSDTLWPYFERLRREDPVHHAVDPRYGPYWSATKYNDIIAIETDQETFSSEPSIMLGDQNTEFALGMFIAMDPPKHEIQRATEGVIRRKSARSRQPIRPRGRATCDGRERRTRAPSPPYSRG
jgi:cytochrome P450